MTYQYKTKFKSFASLLVCVLCAGCASNIVDFHNTDPSNLTNKQKLVDSYRASSLPYENYYIKGDGRDARYVTDFLNRDDRAIRKQLPKGEFLYYEFTGKYCLNKQGLSLALYGEKKYPLYGFISSEYDRYKDLRNSFIFKNKTGYSYRCIRGGTSDKDKKLAHEYANELIGNGNLIGCQYFGSIIERNGNGLFVDGNDIAIYKESLARFGITKTSIDECNALGYHSIYVLYNDIQDVDVNLPLENRELISENKKIKSLYNKKDIDMIMKHQNMIPAHVPGRLIENLCSSYTGTVGVGINLAQDPVKFKEKLDKALRSVVIRREKENECMKVIDNGLIGPKIAPVLFYQMNVYLRDLAKQ